MPGWIKKHASYVLLLSNSLQIQLRGLKVKGKKRIQPANINLKKQSRCGQTHTPGSQDTTRQEGNHNMTERSLNWEDRAALSVCAPDTDVRLSGGRHAHSEGGHHPQHLTGNQTDNQQESEGSSNRL